MVGSHFTQIEETLFDGLGAWRITADSGATALVAAAGATLLSWQPEPGKEVIAGYRSAADLQNTVASRSRIMVPWCGRIKDGSYRFRGKRYCLAGDTPGGAMHGLIGAQEFSRVSSPAALVLSAKIGGVPGYPWNFTVTVTFSLESGADGVEHLSVQITAKNTNSCEIPLAVGWHPYIKIPGMKSINKCRVEIPARTKILVDAQKIPRAGEAAYAGVQAPVVYEYLGSTQEDTSFRGLIPEDDGVVTSVVRDLGSNAEVRISQEPALAPVLHMFTADGLPDGARGSIALEPSSHLPDAFNRADSVASVGLPAGGERTVTVTLSYRCNAG